MIIVSKDGTGDFRTISEAVSAAEEGAEIFVKNGVYRERVEITVPHITLTGESADSTVLEYGLYAEMPMDDGTKRGTFRSYTFFVFTHDFTCRNMTIANTSGFGYDVGQAIAVYAEGDRMFFENCRFLGHQDTLFTGPLPLKEAKPGGFIGPTQFAERRQGRQIYKNCYIEGEVDFIFGSAAALFDGCELYSLDRGDSDVNGYVTASSSYEGSRYGYIMHNCKFTGNCPPRTVYLGRPWRGHAQTVLINCELGAHIKEEGFHDWNKTEAHDTIFYAEYNCHGAGCTPEKRAGYVKQLSKEEAEKYSPEKFIDYWNSK